MESEVTAVGYVHLSNASRRAHISHLHLVRAVDNHPQSRAVHLDVVTHVSQFLHRLWVQFRVYVAVVLRRCQVEEIEGALVAAHIALAQHIHSGDVAARLRAAARVVCGGIDDGVVGAA